MNFFKISNPTLLFAIFAFANVNQILRAEESDKLVLNGAGWMQYGQIGHSTDTISGRNLNGKAIYTSGAQLSAKINFSENAEGVAGIGVFYGHFLSEKISSNGGYAPAFMAPYVSEAHYTYHIQKEEESKLFVRGGLIPFDYNPDIQNLGLYLLRGPVYPGVVISGFETKSVLPVASLLGMQVHHQFGNFEHDFLITSELEYFPYFDISPAYVANYKFGKVFRLGGGVNFYHLIPISDSITNSKWNRKGSSYYDTSRVERITTTGTVIDTTIDSTLIGYSGIKLMANASLDIKALIGAAEIFGKEDLKIYSEVALLGLQNSKAYKAVYGDYMHRMPIMWGFNIPAFNILDRLSLEAEWYGSTVSDDLSGFSQKAGGSQNPLPAKDAELNKITIVERRDNWKWSLYASKIIKGHIKLSGQIANDHFRPWIYSGQGDNNPPKLESVMVSTKDWYTMLKVAFFF